MKKGILKNIMIVIIVFLGIFGTAYASYYIASYLISNGESFIMTATFIDPNNTDKGNNIVVRYDTKENHEYKYNLVSPRDDSKLRINMEAKRLKGEISYEVLDVNHKVIFSKVLTENFSEEVTINQGFHTIKVIFTPGSASSLTLKWEVV